MAGKLHNLGQDGPKQDGGIAIPAFRHDLGIRIKSILVRFSSRKEASKVAGVTAEQLAAYVAGKAKPSFEVLLRLAYEQSISLEWLATGEGPMERRGDHAYMPPLRDTAERPGVAGAAGLDHLDEETIVAAVVAVEEYLAEEGLELDAERKGQLVGLLYDIAIDQADADRPVDQRRNVTRLFKLVS